MVPCGCWGSQQASELTEVEYYRRVQLQLFRRKILWVVEQRTPAGCPHAAQQPHTNVATFNARAAFCPLAAATSRLQSGSWACTALC